MTCKSCVDKWTEYYEKKGFSFITARRMARRVVQRVERRLERERQPYEPMYLIESAGEGIMLVTRPSSHHACILLWLQLRHVNLRASLYWSLKLLRPVWVGKGFNPDYTQACTIGGSCTCNFIGIGCGGPVDCSDTSKCTCPCPAPLPNSHQSSICSAAPDVDGTTCVCGAKTFKCTGAGACTCGGCAGTCGYNCDPGFHWNGVACVAVAAKQQLMDGYFFLEK